MKKFLLLLLILTASITFSKEKKDNTYFNREIRLMIGPIARHGAHNNIYNNNVRVIGLEYRPIKDVGIVGGYFSNSFYKDSYIVGLYKYFRPFDVKLPDFNISVGLGIIKGYYKYNYLYDADGKVTKKSKFNTNIGDDYIVGGSVGVGYDVTEAVTVNVLYVGAYVLLFSFRIF